MESAPDAMVIVNSEGIIQLVNAQTGKMFGFTADEMIGKQVGILLPDKYKKPESLNSFDSAEVLQLGEGFELSGRRKDGEEFPVEMRLSLLDTPEGSVITAAIRDITERRKAELALKEMELEILNQKIQEQKKIARAILKAQENERNRIGQELHDNVNQILVGTKLYLEMARKDDKKGKELIKYSIELIQSSINEIRMLSTKNVTPLKDIDLRQLLQVLTDELGKTTGINYTFVYEVPDQTMDDDLKLNVYRIIQEQINNIIKHSGAANASISIHLADSRIIIVVADDGKGFDVNKKRKGIGISNMINRIESFNGEVHIRSSEGKGCEVKITLPC
jgi:PAS domain S-box-containing protein